MKQLLCILVLVFGIHTGFAGTAGDNKKKEQAPERQVVAKVTDNNGEALAGAKVVVEETGETVYTDWEGQFSLKIKSDKDYSLTVNTIGYKPLQLKASSVTLFSEVKLNSL